MAVPWYEEFPIKLDKDRINFAIFSILAERSKFPENTLRPRVACAEIT